MNGQSLQNLISVICFDQRQFILSESLFPKLKEIWNRSYGVVSVREVKIKEPVKNVNGDSAVFRQYLGGPLFSNKREGIDWGECSINLKITDLFPLRMWHWTGSFVCAEC